MPRETAVATVSCVDVSLCDVMGAPFSDDEWLVVAPFSGRGRQDSEPCQASPAAGVGRATAAAPDTSAMTTMSAA